MIASKTQHPSGMDGRSWTISIDQMRDALDSLI